MWPGGSRPSWGAPEAVVRIHGGIKRHDRRSIQDRFRVDPTARVLVATDAAGEGVNLQVANMVVNYDLPWNPNRIEQRFGRVHRIGQQRPCHLWNLVAFETREGQVFERLFAKIEEQRGVYGDQVYDVLGDAQITVSLRDLLMRAIASDEDPAHVVWMDEVIDTHIGQQMQEVLDERALVAGLADPRRQRQDPPRHGDRPRAAAPTMVRRVVLHRGSPHEWRPYRGSRAGPLRDHPGSCRGPGPRRSRLGSGA